MNKQVSSTLVILLFLIPFIIFVKKGFIDNTTPTNNIHGTISKVECKKVNRRFSGEVYIYYNQNNDFLKFQDDLLNDNTFNSRCRELSKILKIGEVFDARIIGTPERVMGFKVNSYSLLNFDDEVKKFNKMTNMTLLITILIGILLIFGNIIIYYKKFNPDKLLENPWFQKVLYFVAIMGVIKFLLDYFYVL